MTPWKWLVQYAQGVARVIVRAVVRVIALAPGKINTHGDKKGKVISGFALPQYLLNHSIGNTFSGIESSDQWGCPTKRPKKPESA
jgi:hypothetical protein